MRHIYNVRITSENFPHKTLITFTPIVNEVIRKCSVVMRSIIPLKETPFLFFLWHLDMV